MEPPDNFADHFLSGRRSAWLLEIGRHLRAEYDAVLASVPSRLAALVDRLERSTGYDDPEYWRKGAQTMRDLAAHIDDKKLKKQALQVADQFERHAASGEPSRGTTI
jgi:hypothetical protein